MQVLAVVFKRYIKKDGKQIGPYYYQNVRKDGKVRSVYIGKDHRKPEKKVRSSRLLTLMLLSAVLILAFAGFYYLFYSQPAEQALPATQPFTVDQVVIKVLFKEDEFFTKQVKIANVGEQALAFTLSVPRLEQLITISEASFSLEPGQVKSILLNFSAAPGKEVHYAPGVYTGSLVVSSSGSIRTIPIIVEVESKKVFFDMTIAALTAERGIRPGGEAIFDIRMFNLDQMQKNAVEVAYAIKDLEGNALISEKESITIKTQGSFTKSIPIPNYFSPGSYVFTVAATYGSSTGTASYLFDVSGVPAQAEKQQKRSGILTACQGDMYCWSLFSFIVLLAVLVIVFAYLTISAWLSFSYNPFSHLGRALQNAEKHLKAMREKAAQEARARQKVKEQMQKVEQAEAEQLRREKEKQKQAQLEAQREQEGKKQAESSRDTEEQRKAAEAARLELQRQKVAMLQRQREEGERKKQIAREEAERKKQIEAEQKQREEIARKQQRAAELRKLQAEREERARKAEQLQEEQEAQRKEQELAQAKARKLKKLDTMGQELQLLKHKRDGLLEEKGKMEQELAQVQGKRAAAEQGLHKKIEEMQQKVHEVEQQQAAQKDAAAEARKRHANALKEIDDTKKDFMAKQKAAQEAQQQELDNYLQQETAAMKSKMETLTKKERATFQQLKSLEVTSEVRKRQKAFKQEQQAALKAFEVQQGQQREALQKELQAKAKSSGSKPQMHELAAQIETLEHERQDGVKATEAEAGRLERKINAAAARLKNFDTLLKEKQEAVEHLRKELKEMQPGFFQRIFSGFGKPVQKAAEEDVIYQKINEFKQLLNSVKERVQKKDAAGALEQYAVLKKVYDSIAHSDKLSVDAKKYLYETITGVYALVKELNMPGKTK